MGSRILIPVAVLIVVTGAVAPGPAAQRPQPTEEVTVARVVVDARVVDDDGDPIPGLTPEDFAVAIDGQTARVESAQWIGGSSPRDLVVPSTPLAGVLETRGQGRLIVFVVQKSLSSERARGLLRVLQQSERLLTRLTPEDRVAVLSFDSHLKVWLDFTGDLDEVRRVLADDVMFRTPQTLEPTTPPSLLAYLGQAEGRRTYSIEKALQSLGRALEPFPGSKSVVLIGYGFGQLNITLNMIGATLDRDYLAAREALDAARAAVFCLDVTDADYHTFEVGLRTVAEDTGGFFVRTRHFSQRSIDRVANALVGHYVLFVEKPELAPGPHQITVELVRADGAVFARRRFTE